MCGIFAYAGHRNDAPDIILKGLKTLEYRGYDSWGIASVRSENIIQDRRVGKIGNAQTSLKNGYLGVGHTRWATHGGVTQNNAHPHISPSRRFAVVHNGIIENFEKLRKRCIRNGYAFASETDSEIIACLLDTQAQKSQSFKKILAQTARALEGLNSFAVLDAHTQAIGVVRNGSPITVGIGKDEFFISSDVAGLLEHTQSVVFLKDGQGAIIQDGISDIFHISNLSHARAIIEKVGWDAEAAKKGPFPHYLLKEISEQIQTIPQAYALNIHERHYIQQLIREGRRVVVTGCGTAFFCAQASAYHFAESNIPVHVFPAYEIGPFVHLVDDKTIFIAISQSGETADTLIATKLAREKGAHIVGLINARGSSLERLADTVMPVGTGPEIAVVSTKAYTAQLVSLLRLAHLDAEPKHMKTALKNLKRWYSDRLFKEVKALARQLCSKEHIYIIGKHMMYPVAQEFALKIKETSYIHAEAFASGEIKHGMIAMIEKGSPCVVIAQEGSEYQEVISSAQELKARGGYIIGISSKSNPVFDTRVALPRMHELSQIPAVIVGQLLGYYLAVERGLDPDKPRNLAKSVTVK